MSDMPWTNEVPEEPHPQHAPRDDRLLQDDDYAPYCHLHGAKGSHHPLHGPCFICEGQFLVEAALRAHREERLQVLSLLGEPQRLAKLNAPPRVRHLPLSRIALSSLVGFPFHRGVLCAVQIPPPLPLVQLFASKRLVVLPHVDNVDNLGLILRSAAALGMDGVLVGQGPSVWDRRTIRVSMGAAWQVPVWQGSDVASWLLQWQQGGGEVVGAALHPQAIPANQWQPTERSALMLGPEASGLDAHWLAQCQRYVKIPMANNMDSLNVAAAGAILMFCMQFHYCDSIHRKVPY